MSCVFFSTLFSMSFSGQLKKTSGRFCAFQHQHLRVIIIFELSTLELSFAIFPPIRSYRLCSRPEVEAFCLAVFGKPQLAHSHRFHWEKQQRLHDWKKSSAFFNSYCPNGVASSFQGPNHITPGKPWKFWPWFAAVPILGAPDPN